MKKAVAALYVRNFVFGVEDSLVSTVGLLSGAAVAGVERDTIFLIGVVLVFVEAFSMAVGSFLSEYSVEDYLRQAEVSPRRSITGGVVMFCSYLASGSLPLFPYLWFPIDAAVRVSIALALGALFLLGVVGARIAHIRIWRNALRTVLVGTIAIAVGIFVGGFVK